MELENGEQVDTFFQLKAFVNPRFKIFAPNRQLECIVKTVTIDVPHGYVHWI
ncbi:hypothetical protein TUM3792_21470 [Shewanella sp. MBTL60-007]|nr:hypothetical protein TUM3792_21470 [Shewanella sp. MBTL60-007]